MSSGTGGGDMIVNTKDRIAKLEVDFGLLQAAFIEQQKLLLNFAKFMKMKFPELDQRNGNTMTILTGRE